MSTQVKLNHAITVDGVVYDTVLVDEPTAGGLEAYDIAKAANLSDMTAMLDMLAYDLGWPPVVMRKMKMSDLMLVQDAFAPFAAAIARARGPTGEPSSPTAPTSSAPPSGS